MHWSYVLLGLLLYPVVARAVGSPSELGRLARVITLSLLGALPYVFYLYYFHWGTAARIEGQVWPTPGPMEGYFNVFSVGYEHGAVFLLSLAGIIAMATRRGHDRGTDALLVTE